MTDKEKITAILKAYTKKHNISASVVILEEYAEELIANGVIVPPCKVGQIVWLVRDGKIEETTIEKIVLKDKGLYLKLLCHSFYETTCRSIGKTVFLTREEAEKALERSNGNA